MGTTNIKKLLYNDNYLYIAAGEYLKFKQTPEWDEMYKFERLFAVSAEMGGKIITAENVLEVVKYLQKQNPTSGSFAHWGSIGDLEQFAKERPEEVSNLFNELYNEDIDISQRIMNFYKAGKAFNDKAKMIVAMFGYLLAARDYKKYSLIKDSIFYNTVKTFGINDKLNDIGEKYSLYLSVCSEVQSFLREKGFIDNPSMLDVQDFLFCIAEYDALKIKISVRYLYEHSRKLKEYKDSDEKFIDYIKGLDKDLLLKILKLYEKGEKIKRIRYEIAGKLLNTGDINLSEVEDIKARVNNESETNILQSWSNFRILFPFYYEAYKERVRGELEKIYLIIKGIEELREEKFAKAEDVVKDFMYKQNFGDTQCVLILYPDRDKDHKISAQIVLVINDEKIYYGLSAGDMVKDRAGIENHEEIQRPEDFTYYKMRDKIVSVYGRYKELNERYYLLNVFYSRDSDIWDKCREKNIFAMQYQHGKQDSSSVTRNINSAKEVRIGDRVFAYTGDQRILAAGRVTKEFYEEDKEEEFIDKEEPWTQRLGVEWEEKKDKPVFVDSFIETLEPLKPNMLGAQAINEISKEGFERAKALLEGSGIVPVVVDEKIMSFAEFVKSKGFNFDEDVLNNYVLSLKTKPFVILSGISGTGKTKIAQFFAEYMGGAAGRNYAFISVRPDWVDNRSLIGFYNSITGKYQPTALLKLMLRAERDRDRPYFVILDEMNLARVEHYFSDFLSCMESRRIDENGDLSGEAVILHDESDSLSFIDDDGEEYGIPQRIVIPENIYFTGTVNVDETTYMFSPKVLDRANVIEFNSVSFEAYIDSFNVKAQGNSGFAGRDFINKFTSGGSYHRNLTGKNFNIQDIEDYLGHLKNINSILSRYNLHFGYRVFDEVVYYINNSEEMGYFTSMEALDYQILQKVLPKFYGNKKKLMVPLSKLLRYFWGAGIKTGERENELASQDFQYLDTLGSDMQGQGDNGFDTEFKNVKPLFPKSARKLYSMLRALRDNGYANFIE